jgi:hypothetical protein
MAMPIAMHRFDYNPETAHEEWPEWIFLFENFLSLSNINKTEKQAKQGEIPGATKALQHLIHANGRLAVKLLKGIDDDEATYEQLKDALDAYCAPKDNAAGLLKFDSLKQESSETIQDFILRLKNVGKRAGITTVNMEKELIRRICLNTNSVDIRVKAMEKEMTTRKLIEWEAARAAQHSFTSSSSDAQASINYVNDNANKRKHQNNTTNGTQQARKKCGQCGYDLPHRTEKCPAEGKTCDNCGKMNHFGRACRASKQARSNNVNSNNNNSNNRWSTIKSSKKIYNVVETPRDNDKDVSMYNKFYGWLKDDMNDGDEEAQPIKQQQPPQ